MRTPSQLLEDISDAFGSIWMTCCPRIGGHGDEAIRIAREFVQELEQRVRAEIALRHMNCCPAIDEPAGIGGLVVIHSVWKRHED